MINDDVDVTDQYMPSVSETTTSVCCFGGGLSRGVPPYHILQASLRSDHNVAGLSRLARNVCVCFVSPLYCCNKVTEYASLAKKKNRVGCWCNLFFEAALLMMSPWWLFMHPVVLNRVPGGDIYRRRLGSLLVVWLFNV